MKHILKRAWAETLKPIFVSSRKAQVAALCYRDTPSGREVLLITSRDTGRWIIPKGWPIDGLDDAGSALQEAWEEAGVKQAEVPPEAIGTYDYDKRHAHKDDVPVRTQVFAARVLEMRTDYPEAHQRERAWFPAGKASSLVDEPELQALLRAF